MHMSMSMYVHVVATGQQTIVKKSACDACANLMLSVASCALCTCLPPFSTALSCAEHLSVQHAHAHAHTHADLPPLRSWPLDAVALRARVLIGHVRISSDAMAWHGCGLRDGSLAPLCHGPGKGLAALAQSADASCVVLDDQVVLLPACVAPRFFLTLLTGGRAPSPSNWSAGLATRPKLACQDAATASLSPHAAARGNTSLPYTMPYTLHETIRLDDDWLRTSWTRRGSGEAWRACPSDCWPWVDIYEGAFTVALARGGVAVAISPLRVRLLSQVHSTVPFPTEERTFACNETDHVTARSALRAAEDRALHLQQKQVF